MSISSKETFTNRWFVFFSLAIAVFICYLPALKNGFTNWDDQEYVLHNKAIQSLSAGSIAYLFSHFLIISYHPLTLLSLAVNYSLSGTSPFGYIFTNIIFHLLNCCLLFVFLNQINLNKQIAFLVALLFAVHPLNVESVAWIAERKDVLYVFFFLLSLIYYVRYFKTKSQAFYILSMIFFVCSCMSKAQAITLSLILFPLDYYLNGKFEMKNIRNKLPFIILSVVFGILSVKAQGANAQTFAGTEFNFIQRLAFAGYNYLYYLIRPILPIRLSAFYPYPVFFSVISYFYIPLASAIFFFTIYYFRKNKLAIFCMLFFTLNIFFLLQIFPVGDAMIADRYSYLSSIGLFILIVSAMEFFMNKLNEKKYLVQFIAVLIFLFLAQSTFSRCLVWKNGITLWSDVINKYPEATIAYINRGANYNDIGNTTAALSDFKKVIDTDPQNSFALYNAATIYYNDKDFKNSIQILNGIDPRKPANTDAFLLKAYSENKLKDYLSSLMDVEIYLSKKKSAEGYTLSGLNRLMTGDYTNAKKDLDNAIQTDSSFTDAFVKRGVLLFQMGDTTSACNSWQKAASLGNEDVGPFVKLYCK